MTIEEKQIEFMNLLEPVNANLSRFVRALAGNNEDAKDIVCETIMKAYETFENLRSKQAFTSYLFSIASRIHKRRNWRKRFFGDWDNELAAGLKSTEASAETKLDIENLYAALRKLPAKVHEALVFFEISGFSLEEIRQIQGGSLSGVKTRLKRGREKLANIMGVNDEKPHTESIDDKPGNFNRDYNPNGLVLRLYKKEKELNLRASNE